MAESGPGLVLVLVLVLVSAGIKDIAPVVCGGQVVN